MCCHTYIFCFSLPSRGFLPRSQFSCVSPDLWHIFTSFSPFIHHSLFLALTLLVYCTVVPPWEWQRNGEKKYSKKKNPCSLKQFIKKRGMHFQNLPRQFFCHSQGLYRCLSPSRSWQTLGIGLHRLCRWLGSKNGWMTENWFILCSHQRGESFCTLLRKLKVFIIMLSDLNSKIHISGPL